MRKIHFGELPETPYKSSELYPAFSDTECENCGGDIWEGDDLGFVQGEKVCEFCWEDA